jgi:hypothetical protein
MIKILIKYVSNIYDEILGEVEEDCNNFKKGQAVFAVLDYNCNNFIINNNHLLVPEKYIFSIDNEYLPQLLPLLKYGTIIYNSIKLLNITNNSFIEINSEYNIYYLLCKYLEPYTKNIKWINDINNITKTDISIIINGYNVILQNKYMNNSYNLLDDSIIDIYGLDMIKEALEYTNSHRIYADIIYIYMDELKNLFKLETKKKTRFFEIIAYS